MTSSPDSSAERHTALRMPYLPALDGLRALAVIAVLLYHANLPVRGGFLGVEIFFVLSGFLITGILLNEWEHDRRIDLRAFWARRARRLLPALLLVLAAVLGIAAWLPAAETQGIGANVLASLGYVQNWYLIFSGQPYFDAGVRPSLLQHVWSLAIEEQFYLFWPLLLLLGLRFLRLRTILVLTLLLAAGSAGLAAFLYEPGVDPSRIYYGTDTRASGLLLGAALAMLWMPGRRPLQTRRGLGVTLDLLGLAALAGLVYANIVLFAAHPWLYRGGITLVAVGTLVLIVASSHPQARLLPAALGWAPLRWIGTRSYGIYLWHWPIFQVTRPYVDVPFDGPLLLAARITATVVLAELSFRLVEMPIRRGALGRLWRQRSADGDQTVVSRLTLQPAAGVSFAPPFKSPVRTTPLPGGPPRLLRWTLPLLLLIAGLTSGVAYLTAQGNLTTPAWFATAPSPTKTAAAALAAAPAPSATVSAPTTAPTSTAAQPTTALPAPPATAASAVAVSPTALQQSSPAVTSPATTTAAPAVVAAAPEVTTTVDTAVRTPTAIASRPPAATQTVAPAQATDAPAATAVPEAVAAVPRPAAGMALFKSSAAIAEADSSTAEAPTAHNLPRIATATATYPPPTTATATPLPTASPRPAAATAAAQSVLPTIDPALAAALQDVLDRTVADGYIPGAVVSVNIPGRQPWVGASGLANRAAQTPMTPNTRVRIGSVSKVFTAVIALQLAEEGVLSLDDSLERWLPGLLPRGDEITLRMLLQQTTGLYDFLEDRSFVNGAYRNPNRVYAPTELVSYARRFPLAFQPGAAGRWDYSSTNYVILGMVIEKATGNTLALEMHNRIFAPLGLYDTYFTPDETVVGPLATGYARSIAQPEVAMTFAFATANLVSTAADLQTFGHGLFAGDLLSPASREQMLRFVDANGQYDMPQLAYGLGVMRNVLPVAGGADQGTVYGHIGGFGGFRAAVWHAPDSGITISVSVNQALTDPNDLATNVLATVLAGNK